jgi:hypothetical protein
MARPSAATALFAEDGVATTWEGTMRRMLLLAILAVVVGCDEKTNDPNIEVSRKVVQPSGGGHLGPVGGEYKHGSKEESYKGPYSKAPAWAK